MVFLQDEESSIRERFWQVKPGDVVLDIGACEGAYTLPALEAGATVYAVDGQQQPLWRLIHNATDANLRKRLNWACRSLYDGSEYPVELCNAIRNGPHESSRGMVPSAPWSTVDRLVADWELDRLDWLKIDVEGGEFGVLRGAYQSIKRFRPNILIEDHTSVYPWVAEQNTRDLIMAALDLFDYDVTLILDHYPGYVVGRYLEA